MLAKKKGTSKCEQEESRSVFRWRHRPPGMSQTVGQDMTLGTRR